MITTGVSKEKGGTEKKSTQDREYPGHCCNSFQTVPAVGLAPKTDYIGRDSHGQAQSWACNGGLCTPTPPIPAEGWEKSKAFNRPWKQSLKAGEATESQWEMLPAMQRTVGGCFWNRKIHTFKKEEIKYLTDKSMEEINHALTVLIILKVFTQYAFKDFLFKKNTTQRD